MEDGATGVHFQNALRPVYRMRNKLFIIREVPGFRLRLEGVTTQGKYLLSPQRTLYTIENVIMDISCDPYHYKHVVLFRPENGGRLCYGSDKRYQTCKANQCDNLAPITINDFAEGICKRAKDVEKDLTGTGRQKFTTNSKWNNCCKLFSQMNNIHFYYLFSNRGGSVHCVV